MKANLRVLDVGHGNCALARGDDWTLMVDAAPSATVIHALEHLDVERLDALVVSHRDADHARGVVPLLARPELEIGRIYISADAAKDPAAPETALLLAALADAKRSGRCEISRDLDNCLPAGTLDGGGWAVEVLAPTYATAMTGPRGKTSSGRRITSNTVSAVLRVELPEGLRVLLPGDMDQTAFDEIVEQGTDLSADVLVFPHHGSQSTVSDERRFARDLTDAVGAHTVMFSIGRTNRVRPTEAVVRGVLDANPDAYIACTQLSRGCLTADESLPRSSGLLTHLTSTPAAGRSGCRSCAGSMTVTGRGLVGPARSAHQAYVEATADRPMCRLLRAEGHSGPSG